MKRSDLLTLAKEIIADSKFTIPNQAYTGIPLATVLVRVVTAAILTVQLVEGVLKTSPQLYREIDLSEDEKGLVHAIVPVEKQGRRDELLNALEKQLHEFIDGYHGQITQSSAKQKLKTLISRLLNPHIILGSFPAFLAFENTPIKIQESLFGMLCLQLDVQAATLQGDKETKAAFATVLKNMETSDLYAEEVTPEQFAQRGQFAGTISGWAFGTPTALKDFMARYNHIRLSKALFMLTANAELKNTDVAKNYEKLRQLHTAFAEMQAVVASVKSSLDLNGHGDSEKTFRLFTQFEEKVTTASASYTPVKESLDAITPLLSSQLEREAFAKKFKALHPQCKEWGQFFAGLPLPSSAHKRKPDASVFSSSSASVSSALSEASSSSSSSAASEVSPVSSSSSSSLPAPASAAPPPSFTSSPPPGAFRLPPKPSGPIAAATSSSSSQTSSSFSSAAPASSSSSSNLSTSVGITTERGSSSSSAHSSAPSSLPAKNGEAAVEPSDLPDPSAVTFHAAKASTSALSSSVAGATSAAAGSTMSGVAAPSLSPPQLPTGPKPSTLPAPGPASSSSSTTPPLPANPPPPRPQLPAVSPPTAGAPSPRPSARPPVTPSSQSQKPGGSVSNMASLFQNLPAAGSPPPAAKAPVGRLSSTINKAELEKSLANKQQPRGASAAALVSQSLAATSSSSAQSQTSNSSSSSSASSSSALSASPFSSPS